ncbi:hypothetical protein MRX96_041339 [Rhipicephalus microplus]
MSVVTVRVVSVMAVPVPAVVAPVAVVSPVAVVLAVSPRTTRGFHLLGPSPTCARGRSRGPSSAGRGASSGRACSRDPPHLGNVVTPSCVYGWVIVGEDME